MVARGLCDLADGKRRGVLEKVKTSDLISLGALALVGWVAYEKFVKASPAAPVSVGTVGNKQTGLVTQPSFLQPVTFDSSALMPPHITIDDPNLVNGTVDNWESNY